MVSWLDQSGGHGCGNKGSDSGNFLKVKLTIFADGLGVGGQEERGIKDDAKCFGLTAIKNQPPAMRSQGGGGPCKNSFLGPTQVYSAGTVG